MKWVAMRWKTFVWVSRFLSPAMALLCAFAASTCIHVMYTNPPFEVILAIINTGACALNLSTTHRMWTMWDRHGNLRIKGKQP